MIDSHVHIGQYYDMYVSPSLISRIMREVGAEKYAVSSTTMCEEDYDKALAELNELYALDGDRMLPVLWLTPALLALDKESLFLQSGLPWACIKIHPQLHPDFWQSRPDLMDYVVDIAMDLEIPLLIHTGTLYNCEAHRFENVIERHPRQKFILAHGRPIDETVSILKRYDNAFTDTAFMPSADIAALVGEGLTSKVLWGTDSCIIKHFKPKVDIVKDYMGQLEELHRCIDGESYRKITRDNALDLFS